MDLVLAESQDNMINSLQFGLPESAAYITDRKQVHFPSVSGNIFSSSNGNKYLKFVITGEDNNYIDMSSVCLLFDVVNTSTTAGQYLRPLGESHSFFTRYRCNAAGQQINDIDNYNQVCEEMKSFKSEEVRNLDDIQEGCNKDRGRNLNFTTDRTANTDAIAVLNAKQLQNFNNINAINDDLTNNYQTNTVLATNFYNKTEIDSTFTNYYTSTQIDTNLSTNYQNNTLLAIKIYNKGEVDTLIAGAGGGSGYTDVEIDNLLDLRDPKSDFTDRFSAFPIIDCSAPTIIHSGLTFNNETINISPTTGLLFSNQTGGGDKIISVFKNATNYITLQGNKINANATMLQATIVL